MSHALIQLLGLGRDLLLIAGGFLAGGAVGQACEIRRRRKAARDRGIISATNPLARARTRGRP